jgi:uncharacterized membrane protein
MSRSRTIAVVAIAGLVVALGLLLRWDSAREAISGATSSCSALFGDEFDCNRVQASEYAEFAGIPFSIWGVVSGAVLVAWILAARRLGRSGDALILAAGILSLLGVPVALFLFFVSVFVLGAPYCSHCFVIQACTIVLAVLLVPPAWRARGRAAGRVVGLGALLATVILGLGAAGEAYAGNRTRLLRQYHLPTHAELRVDVAGTPLIGDPRTPLSGLMFVEFGCPFCADGYRLARSLVRRYPDKFHFFVKQFPLDRTCNPALPATRHRGACEAAVAGAAATMAGNGPAALDALFKTKAFFPQVLRGLGPKLGVPAEDWARLLSSPRARELIQRDVAEGNALNIVGVPVLYVNGRLTQRADLERLVRSR